MPVVVTFDIKGAPSKERNRIQSLFERLGWENLGGSSYRYPRLGTDDQPVEDWFNHITPALMLFRQYIINSKYSLTKFTIDVQSSSGFNSGSSFGSPPSMASKVKLYDNASASFGKKSLNSGSIIPHIRIDACRCARGQPNFRISLTRARRRSSIEKPPSLGCEPSGGFLGVVRK